MAKDLEYENDTPFHDDLLVGLIKQEKGMLEADKLSFSYLSENDDKGIFTKGKRGKVSYHRIKAHFETADTIYEEVFEISHRGQKNIRQSKVARG